MTTPRKSSPMNRRRFFSEGFRELLRPLAAAVEPLEEAAHHFAETARSNRPRTAATQPYLRPPGALPEREFLDACSRCGECARVCPADCIKIDPAGKIAGGAPYINADAMPCVVCDGLYCMHNCPSGALVGTALMDIDMGTAVWDEAACLRSSGEECTICIDQCPLGTAAIDLHEGKVRVIEAGCIGCGVCQFYCPTDPKSIRVIPKSE